MKIENEIYDYLVREYFQLHEVFEKYIKMEITKLSCFLLCFKILERIYKKGYKHGLEEGNEGLFLHFKSKGD